MRYASQMTAVIETAPRMRIRGVKYPESKNQRADKLIANALKLSKKRPRTVTVSSDGDLYGSTPFIVSGEDNHETRANPEKFDVHEAFN